MNVRNCAQQLQWEKKRDLTGWCFFCPTCCWEGYDRWRQAFCTPPCPSQEGSRIIAKLVFPFTDSLCTASVHQRGKNHPLWQRQTNTPTLSRERLNAMTLSPAIHNKGQWMRCMKMAASSIDIFQSCSAVPQCNLHPTHSLHSLPNNYLLYRGCLPASVRVCERALLSACVFSVRPRDC